MLYLLSADGEVKQLRDATRAELDEEHGQLVCYDEQGREVARFQKLSVTMFSPKPFPGMDEPPALAYC